MRSSLLLPDRPDWRWARAAELSQLSLSEASARLQSEDKETRLAYRFKRAFDHGEIDRYPMHHAAYQLYLENGMSRLFLEGMLLGGADNEAIMENAPFCDEQILEVFHDLFFCVRPYRTKSSWVVSYVIRGSLNSTNMHDRSGMSLRLAWLLGADVFSQMMMRGRLGEAGRSSVRDMVKDISYSQLAEFALSANSRHEAPEGLRMLIEWKHEAGSSGGSDDKMSDAISTFLGDMGITVADPTEASNLQLPAAEPRYIECEVV